MTSLGYPAQRMLTNRGPRAPWSRPRAALAGLLVAAMGIAALPGIGTAAVAPAATPPVERWTRQFGTTEYEDVFTIAVDGLGRSYVAGATGGSLGGATKGGEDAFLRSYTRSGQLRWTRQFGSRADDRAMGDAVDGDGFIVVVGDTSGKLPGPKKGGQDAWVRKYRPDGSLLWARQFGTLQDDEARAVAIDGAGNIFVAGETGGALAGTPKGQTDAFLRKYSPSGSVRWTRQFGTPTADYVDGAAADSSGNAWVIGGTDGDLAGVNAGGFDAVVRKYDASGHHRWTRQFGTTEGDFAEDADADGSGNLIVVGSTDGAMPGGGSDPGASDVFVRKLSPSGADVWTRQFGSDAEDYPNRVDVDGHGNAYIGGGTNGELPGQTQVGGPDAFVVSYGSGGGLRWTLQFGTVAEDSVKGVAVQHVDEVYLSGSTDGELATPPKGSGDAFVRRYVPPG